MKLEMLRRGTYIDNNQVMYLSEGSWGNISESDAERLIESNYELLKMTRPDEDVEFMKLKDVKKRIESGRSVETVKGFIRKKTKLDKCPYCGSSIVLPALSRRGNNIEICSVCGEREAFEDMLGQRGE